SRHRVIQSHGTADITVRFGRERQRKLWARLAGNPCVNLLETFSSGRDLTPAKATDSAQPRRPPLIRIGRLDACAYSVDLLHASGVKQGLSRADACFERERHIVPRPIQQIRQGVGVDPCYGRVPLDREYRATRRLDITS